MLWQGVWGHIRLIESQLSNPWFVGILALCLVYYLVGILNRARHVLQGSKVAKVAAATLDALRSVESSEYPPRRHVWGIVARKNGMKAPILCAECTDNIRPYIIASTVRRCVCCGVAAHDGCLKHVKDTCRPIATPVHPQPHFWVVFGTTFDNGEDLKTGRQEKRCIYCHHAILGGVLTVEPTWVCSYCQAYAHVSCFVDRHRGLHSVYKAHRRALRNQEKGLLGTLYGKETARHHSRSSSWDDDVGAIGHACGPDECKMGDNRGFTLPTSAVQHATHKGDAQESKLTHYNGTNKGKTSKRTKVSRRKRAWWRRVFASQSLDWSKWDILGAALPPQCHPILVFINTKSGPQVGHILRDKFSRILNPLQVVTLPRHDPKAPLRAFSHVPRLRIAIVGGDGTIGWIISCVEELRIEFESSGRSWSAPPIAVMPVGTGNDLARCLGWGSGYNAWKSKGVCNALNEITHALPVTIDRWRLCFAQQMRRKDSIVDKALHMISPRHQQRAMHFSEEEENEELFMNNYLGVGVDAKVALEFHGIRESHPHWFQSQIGNKIVYTGMGALDVVGAIGDQLDLSSKVSLVCDGEDITLPKGSQGVLIVNIASYMGGIDIWEQSDGKIEKMKQSMNDGKLEVLAVYGSFHLGKLTVGLSRATRIAQASRIEIKTTERIPMQIDGEPFRQDPCDIDITWSSHTKMLSPKHRSIVN